MLNNIYGGGTFENYSTDEKVIGRQIDGKPIYRKTFTFTPTTNRETIYSINNINNIDKIQIDTSHSQLQTIESGKSVFQNPISSNLQAFTEVHTQSIVQVRNDGMISVICGKGLFERNPTGYITVQYTKTTD